MRIEIDRLVSICHCNSYNAGWWHDKDGLPYLPKDAGKFNELVEEYLPFIVATKLALIHSEISEAMEGHRRGLMDDKLPHRPAIEVELADAVIRICDLAGALDLDLAGAILEKIDFNVTRPDHDKVQRRKPGGKVY